MSRRAKVPELADGVLAESPRSLTPKQLAFALEYAQNGGDGRAAAAAAGYAEASLDNEPARQLRNPLIQQEILKQTLTRFGLLAPQALGVVESLSRNARSDYVRLQAAQDLLDRAGFRPPDRIDHRVDASLTVSFDIAPSPKVIDGEGG